MAITKNGKVVRSGATPGAAGTMANPGGMGRVSAPKPIYQGPRSVGSAGTMSNPGSMGRNTAARGSVGVGAGTTSMSRNPGTTSSMRSQASRRSTMRRPPVDPSYKGMNSSTAKKGSSAVDNALKQTKGRGLLDLMKKNKGIAIGAGAAVIAGLAYSGKRGEGSSGGRTGMTRY